MDYIIRSHGLTAHFYADDTQIYLAFDHDNEASSMAKLQECIGLELVTAGDGFGYYFINRINILL